MRYLPRVCFLVAAILILLYLWAGRSHWYSEMERDFRFATSPLYSDPIDVSRAGSIDWAVPVEHWVLREGEAHVALKFERKSDIPYERYREKPLRVRFGAYAVGKEGTRTNRAIRNWYFTTDEPLSPEARLWRSGVTEFGLGAVWVYPYETLHITLDVLEPDPVLSRASPRIKIFPKHDYAVLGHAWLPRLLRDGGLVLCAILLLSMTVMYWRSSKPVN